MTETSSAAGPIDATDAATTTAPRGILPGIGSTLITTLAITSAVRKSPSAATPVGFLFFMERWPPVRDTSRPSTPEQQTTHLAVEPSLIAVLAAATSKVGLILRHIAPASTNTLARRLASIDHISFDGRVGAELVTSTDPDEAANFNQGAPSGHRRPAYARAHMNSSP